MNTRVVFDSLWCALLMLAVPLLWWLGWVAFDAPWYLLLLALIPAIWWWSYGGLAGLGPNRRLAALLFRSVVLLFFIVAAAQIQTVRVTDRLTVIYLLDRSESIPADVRDAMVEYVNAAIERHREDKDRVGVIAFGQEAAIEVPAFDYDVQLPPRLESPVDPNYTNLSAALRLALASFPEGAARRVVVVSDGNENLGTAMPEAQALAAAGVGIDVVPIRYGRRGEVVVERVIMPGDVRRGQPFDLKIVVTNTRQATAADAGEVEGTLILKRNIGGRSDEISREKVRLPPGKKVYSVRQQFDSAGFFTYDAEFVPDRPDDDTMRQNNRATAFTHVRGKGQVLLITQEENQGEYTHLVDALRKHNVEVTEVLSKSPFSSLAELQQYDSVILANVPRYAFVDDNQVQMLVRNTQQMGSGLVMLGGPESYGAGSWNNTELEKAMPVDFHVRNNKVIPRGALAMLMHASEIPQGNHWQNVIAREALKALGPNDYCGVIQYNGGAGMNSTGWLWQPGMMQVGENRSAMLARLAKMMPMDMPDFDPGLIIGHQGLIGVPDAAIKHMIVISDGDPSRPSAGVVQRFVNSGITVSTVTVGAHGPAESQTMVDLATATGGKNWKVNDPRALPRIFQREAQRVSKPLIHEKAEGMQPIVNAREHDILKGVQAVPRIKGYVLTTRKENPLVEVLMTAPEPGDEENRTLLAGWTYGLGRTVALTTDATPRWSVAWMGWSDYSKLLSQIVRWSMRPTGDDGNFTVATDYEDGRVKVVVTALDKNDEFLNFLNMQAGVVRPDLEGSDVRMEQIAPGRYVGSFPAKDAGSYMVMITPGAGKAPIRTGINVPYSDEFRNLRPNEPLMEQLAQLVPKGAEPGKMIESPDGLERMEPLLQVNSFRHDLPKATSSQDVWPLLLLVGSCVFFFDVFVRRVQISFAWVPAWAGKLIGRKEAPKVEQTIERLRSRKAEVGDRMAQLRASMKFEPTKETPAEPMLDEPSPSERPSQPAAAPTLTAEQEEESYTSRLLKAKGKVWEKQREKDKD